jgi:hypothetical protein
MNAFVQRVANYIANEVLIKGLANSRIFQRFAVRTDARIQDLHKTSAETLKSVLDESTTIITSANKATAQSVLQRPRPPRGGFGGFMVAFVKEIRKDLGLGK